MAVDHDFSSSTKIGNLTSLNLDLDIIRSLKGCGHLTYDGTRIKWSQDLQLLKNFVENIVGLRGNWSSPGGKAKRFTSVNFDLIATWYPGKQNSLLFQGKDGDLLKNYLVSVLDITCAGQTTTDTDTDFMTNIADSVFETETAEISPVKTCEIITDNNPAVAESTPLKHHSWSYNTFTNDMKGVKTDIAVMQKQITSINNVINSTNAIIESISKVLDSTENRQISYDTRMETLLKEFSIILDEKNRAINERDITIKQLQENLLEIENERNSLKLKNLPTKHVDNKSKTALSPTQPLMCQMNNIEDLINLSKINDLCDIETDVLGDASKSDDMLLSPNTSTIKELEAFIDKSFYSASELSNPVQPTDFCF
jgi:hypothetical protein